MGGALRSWVWGRKDGAYRSGVMEVEGWRGVGNGAESLNLINEGISALCPLCVDSADLFDAAGGGRRYIIDL